MTISLENEIPLDDLIIKERETIWLFIRLLRAIGERDREKAEAIRQSSNDWEVRHAYHEGRGHGYLQCAEEIRAFFKLGVPVEDMNNGKQRRI